MYVLDEYQDPLAIQARDARCQINLLQLIGFLLFRKSTLGTESVDFKQAVFPSGERTLLNIFAGAEPQAKDGQLTGHEYLGDRFLVLAALEVGAGVDRVFPRPSRVVIATRDRVAVKA